jgi:hypothetical protein
MQITKTCGYLMGCHFHRREMSQAELPDAIFLLISSHKHFRFFSAPRCMMDKWSGLLLFFRVYLTIK